MSHTNKQILEAFKKLPEDVKEAMFSVDTVEILREIGEKNKLMIDKIGELADETGLVMLGLTHPNEFISHLTERLEVEHDIAKEIAEEINSKVFFPIRENLKKIHGLAPTAEGVETPTPPETPPAPIPPAPIEVQEPALPTDKVVGTPTESVEAAPPPEISPATQPAPTVASEEPVPTLPTPIESLEPKVDVGKITTPPMIMSMPIDLSKAQKAQTETETPPPPAIFEAEKKEEVFRSPTEMAEKSAEPQKPASPTDPPKKKIDPYREPIL